VRERRLGGNWEEEGKKDGKNCRQDGGREGNR